MWLYEYRIALLTIINARTNKDLKSKYTINFTDEEITSNLTKFPTVYEHFLEGVEKMENLTGNTLNASKETLQIEVYVSEDQGKDVANEIIFTILDKCKALGYEIKMTPVFQSTGDETKRVIARVTKLVTSADNPQRTIN